MGPNRTKYLDLHDAKVACSKDLDCAMIQESTYSGAGSSGTFHGLAYYLCRFDEFEKPAYSSSGIHTYIKRSKFFFGSLYFYLVVIWSKP